MPCGVINDKDKQVVVQLQMREADGSKIQDLSNIPVWSMMNIHLDMNAVAGLMTGATNQSELTRKMVRSTPLGSVVNNVDMQWDNSVVYRVNGQRAIEAECDPNEDIYDATVAKVMDDIKADVEAIPLPDGYTLTWVGELDTSDEAVTALLDFIPITFFIIFGILLLLFNSWKSIFVIITCIPFIICGVSPLLLTFSMPFTFMAIIGLFGLIGMMVKNAIVLVDEINRLRKENQHPYDAVINATVSRIRPVMMASLTTILGMAPLLTDTMYNSMAICIMGGLFVGTIVTLILVPLFYTVVYRIRRPKEETVLSNN
jgi:multidrug efflux pump subunit AcrB